jgi:hypothetical protein
LGHLEGVGHPSALMVIRKNEDLGLACETTKGAGMKDSISITFKAGSPWVWFLRMGAIACTVGSSGQP